MPQNCQQQYTCLGFCFLFVGPQTQTFLIETPSTTLRVDWKLFCKCYSSERNDFVRKCFLFLTGIFIFHFLRKITKCFSMRCFRWCNWKLPRQPLRFYIKRTKTDKLRGVFCVSCLLHRPPVQYFVGWAEKLSFPQFVLWLLHSNQKYFKQPFSFGFLASQEVVYNLASAGCRIVNHRSWYAVRGLEPE